MPGPPFITMATPSASATSSAVAPRSGGGAGVGGDAAVALFGDGDGEGDELLGLGVESTVDEHGAAQSAVALEDGRDVLAQRSDRLAQLVEDLFVGHGLGSWFRGVMVTGGAPSTSKNSSSG